jgi:hypothetical protein
MIINIIPVAPFDAARNIHIELTLEVNFIKGAKISKKSFKKS